MPERIDLERPDREPAPAFHLAPSDGGLRGAGVVVLQEFWGVNEPLLELAERFADAGFEVVVPDLYRGRVTADVREASRWMRELDWDEALADVGGAVAYLKRDGGAAAVVGFCLGGALTLAALARVPECDAGVCFYGIPPRGIADPGCIAVPVQAHFANHDDWCTPDAVDALERAWDANGVEHETHRYDAHHAFMNASRPDVYDPDAAADAWDKTVSFLLRRIC